MQKQNHREKWQKNKQEKTKCRDRKMKMNRQIFLFENATENPQIRMKETKKTYPSYKLITPSGNLIISQSYRDKKVRE